MSKLNIKRAEPVKPGPIEEITFAAGGMAFTYIAGDYAKCQPGKLGRGIGGGYEHIMYGGPQLLRTLADRLFEVAGVIDADRDTSS